VVGEAVADREFGGDGILCRSSSSAGPIRLRRRIPGRAVRACRHDHGVRLEFAIAGDGAGRSTVPDQDALGERGRDDRQIPARSRRIDMGERGIPPHAVDHVHRVAQRATERRLGERTMPRRHFVSRRAPRADRCLGPVEIRLELLARPRVARHPR
jgi:hypothetical protein